jgi:hypothetical protein
MLRRHRRAAAHFQRSEIRALKETASRIPRGLERQARLDVVGNERNASRREPPGELRDLLDRRVSNIDLHERDIWKHARGLRSDDEAIDRQAIAAGMKTAARVDDLAVDLDISELEHGGGGLQQRRVAIEEHRSRDVDERGAAVGQRLDVQIEHGSSEQTRSHDVAVGEIGIADTAAIEQLVCGHQTTRVQNRLAGDVDGGLDDL